MQDFKNKVVVILGGATGIGFGFAKAFGAEGAKIVLAARREERLKEAVSALAADGIQATYKTCDVTDLSQVESLADFAWNWNGHVDVVVNNAGVMVPSAPMVDMPLEDYQFIFNVNFFGVVHGCKVFGKRMIEQGSPAAIYNVGSENSLFHGVPLSGAYVATKHAVLAITQSLKEELPEFIDVSLICPGFVQSELGAEEAMALGMPTDEYVEMAMTQLKENKFFVVSHSYNIERISHRYEMIKTAYDTYAPRHEGDQKYDIRSIATQQVEEGLGRKLRQI